MSSLQFVLLLPAIMDKLVAISTYDLPESKVHTVMLPLRKNPFTVAADSLTLLPGQERIRTWAD
jgi:hypothetical protein